MSHDKYSDLLIKLTHQDDENYHLESLSASLYLAQHFQSTHDERVTKNQKIYDHLEEVLHHYTDVSKFIKENPFPDNNCKLVFLKGVQFSGNLLEFASEELQDDEMVVLTAIKRTASSIQYASTRLKEDRDFVLKVVKMIPRTYSSVIVFEHIPYFHNDDEIAKLAIQQQPKSLKFASARLKNDRNLLLNAAKMDGTILEFIPEHLKDRELVWECVKGGKYASPLKFTPKQYGNDEEIVLRLAKRVGFNMSFVSDTLKSNKEFMLKMLKIKGEYFRGASEELKSDREVVYQAVKSNGISITYANSKFMSDRELVTMAIASNPTLISSLEYELQNDREFIFNNISSVSGLLHFLETSPSPLVNDIEFVNELIDVQCKYSEAMNINKRTKIFNTDQLLRIIRIDPKFINSIENTELKYNRELVLEYILQDRKMVEYLNEELRNDREIIRLALKEHYKALQYASTELKNDKGIVLEAVFYKTSNFEYASEELKQDTEILELAINKDAYNFEYAPESWRNNRDLFLKLVRNSRKDIANFLGYQLKEDRDLIMEISRLTGSIENLPQEFKQDREIVLSAIQQYGEEFKYASRSCRDDRELLLVAIRNGFSLMHLNQSEMDREIVYEACRNDGNNLLYSPEKYRDDEQIVQAAIEYQDYDLKFIEEISERLLNDEVFIRNMAKINGEIVYYLPESLKNDKQVILNALSENKGALKHASQELKNDKELVLTALQYSEICYPHISDEMKNDEEVLLALRKRLPNEYFNNSIIFNKDVALLALHQKSLSSFDYTFKDNRQFALFAVNLEMKNLLHVSNRLKLDRSFILEIEPKDYDILFIPIKLREDREIALKSLERNGKSIIYLSERLRNEFKNDREIMLKAIKSNEIAFLYASEELQNDELFILEAGSLNGRILRYIPYKFVHNREIVLKCVQNYGSALSFAHPKFRNDREIILSAVSNKNSSSSTSLSSNDIRNDKEIILRAIESDSSNLLDATHELISDEDFISQAVDINIECLAYAHYSLRYNPEFLKRMNKDNRIVEKGSKSLKRNIDFDSLLKL